MAINTVVTSGFGNGTFNGTIALVTTRGYLPGVAVAVVAVVPKQFFGPFTKVRILHTGSARDITPTVGRAEGTIVKHGSVRFVAVPTMKANGNRVLRQVTGEARMVAYPSMSAVGKRESAESNLWKAEIEASPSVTRIVIFLGASGCAARVQVIGVAAVRSSAATT